MGTTVTRGHLFACRPARGTGKVPPISAEVSACRRL